VFKTAKKHLLPHYQWPKEDLHSTEIHQQKQLPSTWFMFMFIIVHLYCCLLFLLFKTTAALLKAHGFFYRLRTLVAQKRLIEWLIVPSRRLVGRPGWSGVLIGSTSLIGHPKPRLVGRLENRVCWSMVSSFSTISWSALFLGRFLDLVKVRSGGRWEAAAAVLGKFRP
jgi:hypothetical protein